jgi:hypothetical protein
MPAPLRPATPDDKYYRLRPSRRLYKGLSSEEKTWLRRFNAAVAEAAGTDVQRLPEMPVRAMTRRPLGPAGMGFKYGLPPEHHGFTLASNHFLVILKSVAREMGVAPFPSPRNT